MGVTGRSSGRLEQAETKEREMRSWGIGYALATMAMLGCAGSGDEAEAPEGDGPAPGAWLAELPEGTAATGLPAGEMRTIEATDDAVLAGRTSPTACRVTAKRAKAAWARAQP
jgi:hypothetical protein